MSFNKIIIVGNLGRDPELRYTPQGTPVCSFSVATNEKRKTASGEVQDTTTWFRVTLWNKQAENASKYLTKGRPVYIEGRLRVEEYTDREGKTRQSLEVTATDMQFIGNREDGASTTGRGDYSGVGEYTGATSTAAAPRDNFQETRSAAATRAATRDEAEDFDADGANDEDIPF
jgi:single-strand DNA-binding protein